jgi:NAD-dependent deacetylase
MDIPANLLKALSEARYVVFFTGAGVSAESGIKTFRDSDGLWAKFKPHELASPEGFMSNPQRVWDWYKHRREVINDSQPNAGHKAIAQFENMFLNFALITQNVDRLHQRAGSRRVYELHGNLEENYCFDCKTPYHGETFYEDRIPACPECGGKIRPNVVWFGENLPEEAMDASALAAVECDVFFSVGTSTEVYPAAQLPFLAKDNGAFVVEVNPSRTSLSPYVDVMLQAPSEVALPALMEAYKEYMKEKLK